MDLAAALQRPGLEPNLRCLALAIAAIQAADWPRFATAAAAARDHGPRTAIEETLLQATLFFGFPRVVTAFEELERVWPATSAPTGGDVPPDERDARGRALFAAIYGKNDRAVRDKLFGFHRAFHDFVLESAYGRILSRPGLEPMVRELLAVAALAALDQRPQLIAHARGAIAFGAGRDAVREAVWCAVFDDAATAELLRRV